ncbi:MAG TPA: hypothetical protein VHY48_12720 [Acidobacteriaceae bacterium]|jgi:hypothetical protein|nr:hypothetical protein [Acidobacteriaceae bacterium]
MADQLFLSLWFPNFRLQSLPSALTGVLQQFALVAREGGAHPEFTRVAAASAYPIDWTESPTYQRIYVNDERSQATDPDASLPENAIAEATEQLHDDTAYEFEMRWRLWQPETNTLGLDTQWRLEPSRVRIVGFGPGFDTGSYEQNGHIRVDFGLDTPWTFEGQEGETLDADAAQRIQQNVEKLLAFTLSVEKHCGISSRLLWTESGEPLAEKLIARLQRLN